jgi:hypothetical protein
MYAIELCGFPDVNDQFFSEAEVGQGWDAGSKAVIITV